MKIYKSTASDDYVLFMGLAVICLLLLFVF